MILFESDWKKYPSAIVHLSTKNNSFLEMSAMLRKSGVRNHLMILALHNPKLKDIDPYSENLTMLEMVMIAREINENPWYFFREVARSPASSGSLESSMFEANPANIAVIWCFFSMIADIILNEQIRQTGKSFTSRQLIRGLLNFWTFNSELGLFTKDNALRVETIEAIKSMEVVLPKWLQQTSRKDVNNSQAVTCIRNGNKLVTAVAQKSEIAANNVLRGHTIPIVFMDEPAFSNNIDKSLPAILASTGAARKIARSTGSYVGTLLTTTSGDPSTKSGRYVYDKIYKVGAKFNISYYDAKDREAAIELVKKHSSGGKRILILSFNHKEMGMSEEEFRLRLRESGAEGTDAERDFFLKWVSDGSKKPIDTKVLRIVSSSEISPKYAPIRDTGHIIEWFITEEEVKMYRNKPIVAGIDTSDLIGQDSLDIVIMDSISGAVIGIGHFNMGLLDDISELIVSLLLEFKKLVIIPEKKSSAMAIMDTVAKMLVNLNINPFKRIFNKVVQHADKKLLDDISRLSGNGVLKYYIKQKKNFGYTTTGEGEHSRLNLYSKLEDNLRYLGSTIRSKHLISQINGLINKNGRIDHGELGDDAVIAFMLAVYLLRNGENIEFYGLDSNIVLSNMHKYDLEAINSIKAYEDNLVKETIYNAIGELLNKLEGENDKFKIDSLEKRIYKLERVLGDNQRNRSLNIAKKIENIRNKKRGM